MRANEHRAAPDRPYLIRARVQCEQAVAEKRHQRHARQIEVHCDSVGMWRRGKRRVARCCHCFCLFFWIN